MAEQYLLVQAKNSWHGINLCHVDNVVRPPKIIRVPGAQAYFKGIIHLRGEILAIMSLRLKMGFLEEGETPESRIVILRHKELGTVGMLVDRTGDVMELTNEDAKQENISLLRPEDIFHEA